tara:strand:- start:4698 stop:4916 length:219 start_codon:yes stop_codon:yes gene_type:complete
MKKKHYQIWENFETLDLLKKCLSKNEYIGFLKGNILKYQLRNKGQDELDLEKIKDYKNELTKQISKKWTKEK